MTRELEQFAKDEQRREVEDKIRQRAHEIWEEEGRPEGRAEKHWLQAENEIPQNSRLKVRRAKR